MPKLLISALLACLTLTMAHAGDISASDLIGTWCWDHVRHEVVVTYKDDGTYESKSSNSSDDWKIHSDSGTWKIEGNNLIETSSKEGSTPTSSVIEFQGKDRFRLDDFMDFYRSE